MKRAAPAALAFLLLVSSGCGGKDTASVAEENQRTLDAIRLVQSTQNKQKDNVDRIEAELKAGPPPPPAEPEAVLRTRQVAEFEARRKEIEARLAPAFPVTPVPPPADSGPPKDPYDETA